MKFLIFAALVAFVTAQSDRPYPVFNQTCVERKAQIRESVKTAFNVAAYSGTWFEIERYQQRDESEADCMSSQYSWGFISRSFSISRTGHDFANDTGFNRQATALLSFPDISPTIGLLNVTYYADREANEVNYYVIATDYFQYAVGWGCEDIEVEGEAASREFAWVLSRTPELPDDPVVLARIESYVDRYLDRQFLRWTIQSEAYCLDRVMPGGGRRTKEDYVKKQ